jgi:hypothetical protein
MGWVPERSVLHEVEIHSYSNGLFTIKVTDGLNPAHIYRTSFTNATSYGGEIGPAAIGVASALFDNFSIQAVVPGDFNNSGTVDTADYVVWRKGLGTIYTQNDYNVWRAHFGQTASSGAGDGMNAAVPEPASLVSSVVAMAGLCFCGWRCRHRRERMAISQTP